jgi:hypothetical protein
MALFKAIGGHAALFLVVPIAAALLVWSTFAVGRALGILIARARRGLAHRDEPAFLTMVKEPMSDVPAAAFWALATWTALDASRWSSLVPGVSAAIAILIRPNLVPLAAVLGAWMLWPRAEDSLRNRLRSLVVFSIPVVLRAW